MGAYAADALWRKKKKGESIKKKEDRNDDCNNDPEGPGGGPEGPGGPPNNNNPCKNHILCCKKPWEDKNEGLCLKPENHEVDLNFWDTSKGKWLRDGLGTLASAEFLRESLFNRRRDN